MHRNICTIGAPRAARWRASGVALAVVVGLGVGLGVGLAAGACHVSVSVTPAGPAMTGPLKAKPAPGDWPAAADEVRAADRELHFPWQHPGLAAGDVVTGRLVAVQVGAAAAPNTEVTRTTVTAAAGDTAGDFVFTLPTPWPPGRYRVEASRGDVQFAAQEFDVLP